MFMYHVVLRSLKNGIVKERLVAANCENEAMAFAIKDVNSPEYVVVLIQCLRRIVPEPMPLDNTPIPNNLIKIDFKTKKRIAV